MPSMQAVVEFFFRYPAKQILKDSNDLRQGHKILRNTIQLFGAFIGFILGLALPLWISPQYGGYLSQLISKAFEFGPIPTQIGSVIASIWGTIYFSLVLTKQSLRGLYHLKFGDTNSAHFLSDSKLNELTEIYTNDFLIENSIGMRDHIRSIFDFLISKIHKAQFLESDKKHFNALHTLQQETSKAEIKFILREFLAGNIDPYDNYAILERGKQKLINDKLCQRIDYINDAYQLNEGSTTQRARRTQASISQLSHIRAPRFHEMYDSSNTEEPTAAIVLELPSAALKLGSNSNAVSTPERSRDSCVDLEVTAHPKRSITRMMQQWQTFDGQTRLDKDEKSLGRLIQWLSRQKETLHQQTTNIPPPAPVSLARGTEQLPPPARPRRA